MVFGAAFGTSPAFRVSYATSDDALREACTRISGFLRGADITMGGGRDYYFRPRPGGAMLLRIAYDARLRRSEMHRIAGINRATGAVNVADGHELTDPERALIDAWLASGNGMQGDAAKGRRTDWPYRPLGPVQGQPSRIGRCHRRAAFGHARPARSAGAQSRATRAKTRIGHFCGRGVKKNLAAPINLYQPLTLCAQIRKRMRRGRTDGERFVFFSPTLHPTHDGRGQAILASSHSLPSRGANHLSPPDARTWHGAGRA